MANGTPTGAAITWALSGNGKILTGTINGGTQTAITVSITDTGSFTVTQSLPIFHPDTASEDVKSFTIDVNVNDGTTTTVKVDAITVNLEDDSPFAAVSAANMSSRLPATVNSATGPAIWPLTIRKPEAPRL